MFFPFVGLVLAVCWPVALWIYNWPAPRPLLSKAVAILCACELALCAMATRQRNTVWHTEESLWRDVAIKSPRNGRGWMNYALILAGRHDLQGALTYLNRASIYQPYYSRLELNLGVVYGELKHSVEAERHFRRAFRLAPDDLDCHVAYANWLDREGRSDEAMKHLRIAMTANPDALDSRYLMMTIDAKQARWTDVTAMAADILKRFPSDLTANAFVLMSDWETAGPARTAKALQTPDNFVNLSVLYFQADNLEKCIAAAREALKLRPNYAAAYNNIAAAYQGLKEWDKASEAAHAALKIRPDYQPAQQNLARSEAQKRGRSTTNRTETTRAAHGPLERVSKGDLDAARRNEVSAAERGKKIVKCHLVGHVQYREPGRDSAAVFFVSRLSVPIPRLNRLRGFTRFGL